MPHAFIASAAETVSPRNDTSDSPISASAICASCTKSPLALTAAGEIIPEGRTNARMANKPEFPVSLD